MNRDFSMNWIPSSTALPDDETLVLLALSDGEVWTGYRDGDAWRYVDGSIIESATVTHWMHLPPAPKAAEAVAAAAQPFPSAIGNFVSCKAVSLQPVTRSKTWNPADGSDAQAVLEFLKSAPGSKVRAIATATGIDNNTLYAVLQQLSRNGRAIGQPYLGNKKEWSAL